LVLVGHNPGMQHLAVTLADPDSGEPLTRAYERYPTSGIAVLSVSGEWADLAPGGALLTEFAVPRGDGAGEDEGGD
jgi:phosphohistidine phosphatase